MGRHHFPFYEKLSRDKLATTPKFYFFDNGVANFLKKTSFDSLRGADAGNSFEAFIFHELIAYKTYFDKNISLTFWRTQGGKEIDFIINKAEIGIEVKIASKITSKELKSFNQFLQYYPQAQCLLVCTTDYDRVVEIENGKVQIVNVYNFLTKLWDGKYF